MVKVERSFLIDSALLIERARRTFFDTPLLVHGGKDFTLVFGCLRDFLRLRRELGMMAGAFVAGSAAHALATGNIIGDLLAILKKLGIACVHAPLKHELQLAAAISSRFSAIVTADRRFLQLCTQDCNVVLFKPTGQPEYERMSPETVKLEMGATPEQVPTYLALTDGPPESALTGQQAARLVALFGDLDSIYKSLAKMSSAEIRMKLERFESCIRGRFAAGMCCTDKHRRDRGVDPESFMGIDTKENCKTLKDYGFFSLLPLLPQQSNIRSEVVTAPAQGGTFRAVVDRRGLEVLESVVGMSKVCAIDAETDNKDPRKAMLLGIAFAAKAGEAYFLLLVETVLKDIPRSAAVNALKRIFSSDVDFIGHNIKYDYLLLRRIGIAIKHVHFDTMLAAFECHGDWPFFKLQYLAQRLLGRRIKSYRDLLDEGDGGTELPFREMVDHACQDADATLRLYPVLSSELAERNLEDQYQHQSMGLLLRLADLEFSGVSVNVRRINRLRGSLLAEALQLRSGACREAGRDFDVDSEREVFEVLGEAARSRGYFGPRRIPLSMLEELAITNPVARWVVQYRRLRIQVSRLESISSTASRGVIHLLFNQIRSRCGLLSTTDPSLFDIPPQLGLESCFDRSMRQFFRHPEQGLERLAELTKDPVLRKVRGSRSQVDPCMARHPLMQGLNCDDFLLSLAFGLSDAKLSKRFLIDRLRAATIRHDLERRYRVMFQWLNAFCRTTQAKGFAASEGLKKYIDGLRCSDLARREQALEHAVRWLVRY